MSQRHYPDLAAPPLGWTGGRQGAAIRLVPPGAFLDSSATAMIVSPLVPMSRQLPPPATVILQALSTELASAQVALIQRGDPVAVTARSGLTGARLEAELRLPSSQIQRRIYTMYADDAWLYGVHLLADEAGFRLHRATYDAVAASVMPFPAA